MPAVPLAKRKLGAGAFASQRDSRWYEGLEIILYVSVFCSYMCFRNARFSNCEGFARVFDVHVSVNDKHPFERD
jgi:hypothetical protein